MIVRIPGEFDCVGFSRVDQVCLPWTLGGREEFRVVWEPLMMHQARPDPNPYLEGSYRWGV